MLVLRNLASSRASSPTSGSRMLMPMTASVYTCFGLAYIPRAPPPSMIVPRHAHGLRQALVVDRGLQHHSFVKLRHHFALDLLPRRLALGIVVTALMGEGSAALVELGVRDKDIGRALVQIDAHAVPRLQEREAASHRRLGGG